METFNYINFLSWNNKIQNTNFNFNNSFTKLNENNKNFNNHKLNNN